MEMITKNEKIEVMSRENARQTQIMKEKMPSN